jgi:hypothetical protein
MLVGCIVSGSEEIVTDYKSVDRWAPTRVDIDSQ